MTLQRDKAKILAALGDLPNGTVIAKQAISIQFPSRFRDIKLAVVGENNYVYGLFALILGDSYALLNMNGYIELGKGTISLSTVQGQEYFTITYQPGDVVIKTKSIVARSNLIFTAIDEFVFKGKVPWYVNYEDMGQLFDTAQDYAKTKATMLPPVIEFLAAYIARSKQDRTKFIREVAKQPKDFALDQVSWVPLRSVFWSAPGTVNKLSGAYFADGVVSALVNPNNKVEKVESILRA